MPRRVQALALGAAAAAVLTISSAPSANAVEIPDHHTITCDTASFYAHYAIGSGPFDFVRTLYKGKDIGHSYGKQEEINGWAYSQDFGPNDWGYVEMSCF